MITLGRSVEAFVGTTMLRAVFIFGSFLAVTWGQSTQVSQCVTHQGELPLNTYIAGCDVPPCRLPILENAVINIIFKAPRTMRSMTTAATAYLTVLGLPVPIPYPLGDNALTCNFLDNSYCPVLEGEVLKYTLLMYIEANFGVGTAPTIEFRIVDSANSSPFVCIRVPVIIAEANTGVNHAARNATGVNHAARNATGVFDL